MKYIKWLFWTLYYLPQPKPKDFNKYMTRMLRTFSPWWKFKPFIMYNPDGLLWHVLWSNESVVTKSILLTVDCDVTNSGKIVGMTLYDSQLKGPR